MGNDGLSLSDVVGGGVADGGAPEAPHSRPELANRSLSQHSPLNFSAAAGLMSTLAHPRPQHQPNDQMRSKSEGTSIPQ